MKKTVLLFTIIFLFFFSCKKESVPVVIDIDGIRAQLASLPSVTKEEVSTLLSSVSGLKSTTVELTSVQIFDLSSDVYQINDKQAIKFAVYYEIDSNNSVKKFLTIKQFFTVKNGIVDTSNYTLGYEVGCSLSKDFQLSATGNVNQIIYFFHFNDGKQFTYFGNPSSIKLPPIANGKWQLMVTFYDSGLLQQFTSDLVDYSNQSNIINLRLDLKNKNTVSIIKIDKNLIKNADNVWVGGYDSNANYQGITFKVIYDESMPSMLSFEVPFNIWDIKITLSNGVCVTLATKNAKSKTINADGTVTYVM
ncbi:MAG: hypothetical protein WCI91_01975 [Candidatus Nomurabacteria bacterium]